jgi:hypothetical protein
MGGRARALAPESKPYATALPIDSYDVFLMLGA